MNPGTGASTDQVVELLRAAARAMRSPAVGSAEEARAIHAAVNALQARESDLLAEMDATKAHEFDGAASIATWAARELRQDAVTTRQMVHASRTMRDLASTGAAAHTGSLSLDHVHAMTFSLKHVGHDVTVQAEKALLNLASMTTPSELFAAVRRARDEIHSDELDKKWLKGMDKQDIRCSPVGDGFHPHGFLPIDVGAKLRAYLDAVSVPRDADDLRSNAQRRVDALDDLVTRALEGGLPGDNGVRAHVSVVVEAERLKQALNRDRDTDPELDLDRAPAILEGFGSIGPALLAYIVFGSNLTPILVDGFKANRKILDVGRTRRIATKAQRAAIHLRQNSRCANRGCYHPIGEIHHIDDWLFGGKTDLANLVGLCRKCHSLITMGRLAMSGTFEDGYRFMPIRGRPMARAG